MLYRADRAKKAEEQLGQLRDMEEAKKQAERKIAELTQTAAEE